MNTVSISQKLTDLNMLFHKIEFLKGICGKEQEQEFKTLSAKLLQQSKAEFVAILQMLKHEYDKASSV